MIKLLSGLLLMFYLGTINANQDKEFIAANQAYRTGNISQLTIHAKRLQHHVLATYIEYYQLRLQLEQVDPAIIKAFLFQNQGSYIADSLRGEWLSILGKERRWRLFANEYPKLINNHNDELTCYSLQQRLLANDKRAFSDAYPLWFTKVSMPNSCTSVFDTLIANGWITTRDIWQRIRLTLATGQTGIAKHINLHLPNNQALNISNLNAAARNPLRYLQQSKKIKTQADRETALFAILLLLRSDINRAVANWPKISQQLHEVDKAYFYRELAYRAALRHDNRALDWFAEAAKLNIFAALTNDQLFWKSRAALRSGDWQLLLMSIEEMPPSVQLEDSWRYWKARALLATEKLSEANAILAPLSTEYSFYGQLAKEELGTILSIPAKSHHISKDEINDIKQMAGIQRSLALFRLNLRTEAVREWNWAIRHLNQKQLLAAANVAHQHHIYDRAIHTAEKITQYPDFNLRFPVPHRQQLQPMLQQQELDEAWVYGLIHQESRFIANAHSHAGAMGLMQVMPATAKWVANKLGLRNYRQQLAVEIDINLRLGSYYLKHVLTEFDNQALLALAAYNAGPGRAKRWRKTSQSLEGAIFAETIPFRETRNYVKKVMSNLMIYNKILNDDHYAPTLKQRLDIIDPQDPQDPQ